MRVSRRWAFVASLFLIVGVASPAGASVHGLDAQASGATSFATQAYAPLRTTQAQQVTKDDPSPTRTFSEPYMLVDPANPKVIMAAAVEMRTGVCYLMRSTDAGKSWHILPALPGTNSFPQCFTVNGGTTQSPMAWGRNHTLYYALLGYDQADGGDGRSGNMSVLLARSTDLGQTFTTTVVDNNRGKTGDNITQDSPVASVAVDTHSGSHDIVYVGWNQSLPKSSNPTSPTLVATSTDGGQTFGKPVDLNGFYKQTYTDTDGTKYDYTFGTPYLAVGRTGTVYVVASESVSFNVMKFPPLNLLAASSTDRGKTWTAHSFDTPSFDLSQPEFALSTQGASDNLAIVYQDKFGGQAQGNEDIYFQHSTNGGQTWSSPIRLNDDDTSLQNEHNFPDISIAPNGRIDVVWYDYRNGLNNSDDVYYTYSTDGGATFAHDIRVTDQSINRSVGPNTNFDIRIEPGVASTNSYAAIGWTDTRLATDATQTVDVFGSVVQFKAVTTSSSPTLKYLAAGAAGLVIAGVLVLVIGVLRRRRVEPPTPPPAPAGRKPEPVGVS
ncbi:MAG: sialidase family protein [Acidimicrobiales bacterium]